MMLHTKYQGSMPYGFRQEDFSCFPYISLCKTCGPWGVAIFGPRGHNWEKLGTSTRRCFIPIIKALCLGASNLRIIFMFLPI